jgi:hypothetical protein
MRQLQESNWIRCWTLASRKVRLGKPFVHRFPIIHQRIGVPDVKIPTMSVYIHSAPRRIPIWNPARSKVCLNENRFYKQNFNFKKQNSQEFKGRSEKFKNPKLFLVIGPRLTVHTLNLIFSWDCPFRIGSKINAQGWRWISMRFTTMEKNSNFRFAPSPIIAHHRNLHFAYGKVVRLYIYKKKLVYFAKLYFFQKSL